MERKWDTELNQHAPLQNMKITMFGKVYELQPAADLEFHPSTAGEELQRQPGLYAFYASVRSMCQQKVNDINKLMDKQRSKVDQEYREAGELPGGVKITEDAMRRAIRLDDNIVNIDEALSRASFDLLIMSDVVRAFEHRRECLIELAKRTANTTFNDQDVVVTVSANISKVVAQATASKVGQHPSKK